jgi:hypothetical protein
MMGEGDVAGEVTEEGLLAISGWRAKSGKERPQAV